MFMGFLELELIDGPGLSLSLCSILQCSYLDTIPWRTGQDYRFQPLYLAMYYQLRLLPVPLFDIRVLLLEDHYIALHRPPSY